MEVLELLNQYLVLVVFGICYFTAEAIKALPKVNNKYIPLIVGIIGVIINSWVNGWMFTPEIMLGGLASGWASTGAYETVKNLLSK